MMVGVGNHESFYNFTSVNARYKMPQSTSLGSQQNFWFTFTYGNIQWVSISSEHDLSEGSPQITFLRNALVQANANRNNVPWIVLSIHKPVYCSVEGSPSFASKIESLLLEFDVDLTISGHMHAYERIHPVKNGEVTVFPQQQANLQSVLTSSDHCNQYCDLRGPVDVYHSLGFGPVHIMQGHAGAVQAERWTQPSPAWSAFRMANGLIPRNKSSSLSTENGDNKHLESKAILWNSAAEWMEAHDFVVDLSDSTPYTTDQLADLPMLYRSDIFNLDPNISLSFNYSHTFGFGYITAVNATHLHYQAIPNVDGLLNHDEFWIVKDRTLV
jgi:hypothetical protein